MLHHESGRHLPGINQWGNKREGVVPLFDSRVTGTTKHLQPKEYKNNSPHLVGCKLQFLRILLALSVWNLVVSLLKDSAPRQLSISPTAFIPVPEQLQSHIVTGLARPHGTEGTLLHPQPGRAQK